MAESVRLRDVLLAELSDVNLFCKLIKYPSIRDNMLKTFKVRKQLILTQFLRQCVLLFSQRVIPRRAISAIINSVDFYFPCKMWKRLFVKNK
jgi:hypothetical protein